MICTKLGYPRVGEWWGLYYVEASNCTIAGNSAQNAGGGVYTFDGGLARNCIIHGNTAPTGAEWGNDYWKDGVLEYCCTSPTNPPNCTNCLAVAPRFINAPAANYRLAPDSPCIDAGLDAFASGTVDLDGNPRVRGLTVDMGCYEAAPAEEDTDGDGLPDWWELLYSGNITNMVAGVDGDGDGVDNLGEYGADTHPNSNKAGYAHNPSEPRMDANVHQCCSCL